MRKRYYDKALGNAGENDGREGPYDWNSFRAYVPGAGDRLLRFLLLLVEQLTRAFRRLAGDGLHRHA